MEDEKRESFSLPRMGRWKMKKRKFQSPKDGEVEDEIKKVSVAQGWGGRR